MRSENWTIADIFEAADVDHKGFVNSNDL